MSDKVAAQSLLFLFTTLIFSPLLSYYSTLLLLLFLCFPRPYITLLRCSDVKPLSLTHSLKKRFSCFNVTWVYIKSGKRLNVYRLRYKLPRICKFYTTLWNFETSELNNDLNNLNKVLDVWCIGFLVSSCLVAVL